VQLKLLNLAQLDLELSESISSLMKPATALYIHLRLNCKRIDFSTYKQFCEWIDPYNLYHYVLPAQRHEPVELGVALASEFNGDLTAAWHRFCDITTCIPHQEQKEIEEWLRGRFRAKWNLDIE
jgi:hypothetical protein